MDLANYCFNCSQNALGLFIAVTEILRLRYVFEEDGKVSMHALTILLVIWRHLSKEIAFSLKSSRPNLSSINTLMIPLTFFLQ